MTTTNKATLKGFESLDPLGSRKEVHLNCHEDLEALGSRTNAQPNYHDDRQHVPTKWLRPAYPTTADLNKPPITTSIFDMFKIGPGPSSSHTIGPMKASFDFLQDLRQLFSGSECPDRTSTTYRIEIHLHGSLSATGKGHKTDNAIIGGLLGWRPATCDDQALTDLMTKPGQLYKVPIVYSSDFSGEARSHDYTVQTIDQKNEDVDGAPSTPTTRGSLELAPKNLHPIDDLYVGAHSLVWCDPSAGAQFPHPNTMILILLDSHGRVVLANEYYSVGGGFVQKKGCPVDDTRTTSPEYPYATWTQFRQHLETNQDLDLAELMIRNEIALTGAKREDILASVETILETMEDCVERGLRRRGILPGLIGLERKAAHMFKQAKHDSFKADGFLAFLNAYTVAASEENADGRKVVTAPTSGSAGVFPGLIYFMKHHLYYDQDLIARGLLAGAAVGFVVKTNASISGAEMGCMGEVGVASSMGAAMLTYAAGGDIHQIEAAAEIAIEHHLGVTCDPISGTVQIPCIQRNAMGAIKAYNAHLLARLNESSQQKISLDMVVEVMRQTGRDMSEKYKETSQGGLALSMTEC